MKDLYKRALVNWMKDYKNRILTKLENKEQLSENEMKFIELFMKGKIK